VAIAHETVESPSSGYRSDYTNAQLYALVKEAALKTRPERPAKLSTRQFNEARAGLGQPSAPSAKWIAERLGASWPELVKVAINEARDATMTDSAARRTPAEKWLDIRHLYFALNFVAKKRGEQSFTDACYDTTREEVLSAGKHGEARALAAILPTSGQLIQIVRRIEAAGTNKTKDAEEAAAAKQNAAAADDQTKASDPDENKNGKRGKPRAKKTKKTRELLPQLDADETPPTEEEQTGWWNRALALAGLNAYKPVKDKGVSITQAIHLFIETTGMLPSSRAELERLAREGKFSLSKRRDGDGKQGNIIRSLLPEVAELRASLGLPMADEIAPRTRKVKPAFDLSKLPSDLPPPVRTSDYWVTHQELILDALCEYLDTVAARNVRQPTRRDYIKQHDLLKRRGEWPAAVTLDRVGEKSFSGWIRLAEVEWQKRKK
jgi:hypothetical protein